MKQDMLIKTLEGLLDHLHMMPDSPTDKAMKSMMPEGMGKEGKGGKGLGAGLGKVLGEGGEVEIKIEKKSPKMGMMEDGEEEESPEMDLEEDSQEVKDAADKAERDYKPKGLFEMISKEEDDPDMAEYAAKKERARQSMMKYKGL